MIPLPLKPKIVSDRGHRTVFEVEGLYPGYGQTIGNSLRRVLLSSLKGAAVTSVKVGGIGHEFSTMEGVSEDLVDLMLNLKQLRFRLHGDGPFTITLSAKGEGEVTAGDFKVPPEVEVVNPDAYVLTMTSKRSNLEIEASVESGLGYVPVETRAKERVQVGTIALDAAFSPVRHVNYEVENMRVGDRTDYNRLRITVETDGSVTSQEAFRRATEILVEQCSALSGGFQMGEEESSDETGTRAEEETTDDGMRRGEGSEGEETRDMMKMKLNELKLSSRTLNALREAGIKTVGGISRKREETLREIEGLGDKAMQEIKKALGHLGVTLRQ